ncbi:MFS transporter [Nonomuraea antimicrobica]|uniref:MFS transporter n=1 Tax=Nonomuraea antimicrobica TaxID=561173 RepID=A0ABP7DJS6_9ACTN
MTEAAPPGIGALWGGNRDFRRLLAAGLISQTGDWAIGTGLAFHVYLLTGSTLSTATMLLASRLPDVVLGPVAGMLADRWDRRRLLVGTDLLLALGLLPLLAVREPDQVWIVYAVALWTGALGTVLAPAQKALLPRLVPESHLVRANALHGQSGQAARLIGALAGGLAVGAGGLAAVVWIDVAGFLLSALLLASLRTSSPAGGERAPARRGPSVLRERGVRLLVAYMVITGLGEGVFATLATPFVADVLGGGGDAYGAFLSVQAVGGIAGGLAVAAWPGDAPPRALLGWGTVVFGLADLALFAYPLAWPVLWPALVLIVVAGVPAAAATAGLTTLAQTATGGDRAGAVFGLLGSAHAATGLLGLSIAGALGDRIGIVPTLCLHAAGLVGAGLMVLRRGR